MQARQIPAQHEWRGSACRQPRGGRAGCRRRPPPTDAATVLSPRRTWHPAPWPVQGSTVISSSMDEGPERKAEPSPASCFPASDDG